MLAILIVVNVVQHCSGPKVSKIGYLGKNFARPAYGGAYDLRKNDPNHNINLLLDLLKDGGRSGELGT